MNYPWKYFTVSMHTKIDIGTKFCKATNHDKERSTTLRKIFYLKISSILSIRYA